MRRAFKWILIGTFVFGWPRIGTPFLLCYLTYRLARVVVRKVRQW